LKGTPEIKNIFYVNKVKAVRSAVLGDAQRYARKHLDILDKDIDAWKKLLESGTSIARCLSVRRWIRTPPPSRASLSEPNQVSRDCQGTDGPRMEEGERG